jgi:hypothetical protein
MIMRSHCTRSGSRKIHGMKSTWKITMSNEITSRQNKRAKGQTDFD